MPLESVPALMQRAREGGYAVGYFESWNLESLYGVLEAAERARAPIIIGFNGEFLSRAERTAAERLSWYGALGRVAALEASIPCGFIFNECSRDDWTRAAVTAGFNLVMPADPAASADDYARRVRALVDYARPRDVAVEAELGELPRVFQASRTARAQRPIRMARRISSVQLASTCSPSASATYTCRSPAV